MTAHIVPVPSELWRRLARLDARCDISMRRFDPNQRGTDGRMTTSVNFHRAWEVRIGLTGRPETTLCVFGGSALASVLEQAVTTAEQNGWHLPQPNSDGGSSALAGGSVTSTR